MPIHQVHLPTTSSTQEDLKRFLQHNPSPGEVLISTDRQQSGQGRQGARWRHLSRALAFSFTLRPASTLTLTPLEIGVHLSQFFSPKVCLKWPNDLLNQQKEKVGGIICQLYKDVIMVGIGINLQASENESTDGFPYPVGFIFDDANLSPNFKKTLPHQIYEHILSNRLSDEEIKQKWLRDSSHLNQTVRIIDQEVEHHGKFTSLGQNGEAVLTDNQGEEVKILTGSLRFN